jgi:hypothetical protein
MRVALIMAAGEHKRWIGTMPKQMVDVAGEPLIARTMRQLHNLDTPAIVATHVPEIQEIVGAYCVPKPRRWICEGLLNTQELWNDETIVLLGDVVWPDEVLRQVVNSKKRPAVFGNYCEIYAAAFNRDHHERVVAALRRAIADAEEGSEGKLWHFYYSLAGFENIRKRQWNYDVFEVIPSNGTPTVAFTQDFDWWDDYVEFLETNEWARTENNWPPPEPRSHLGCILTGTGRCATKFWSKLLTELGFDCGHEAIFGLGGLLQAKSSLLEFPDLKADSSWLAAPFLDSDLAAKAFAVHLVRHPKLYIQSELKIKTYSAQHLESYMDFTRRYLPGLDAIESLPTKSAYRYVHWNELIEEKLTGRDSVRFQIEREPMELLEELGKRGLIDLADVDAETLFSNRRYNTKSKRQVEVALDDIEEPIRSEMLEMARRYGYTWTKTTNTTPAGKKAPSAPTIESSPPVIKCVITTMDNLPNNKEQLDVLRSDPLISEIVIVNQESLDGTKEWLNEQPDVTAIHRANNGAGPGRNSGIDEAGEFDYLLLLDGGIRPLHNGTMYLLDYLDRHPEVDVVAPDWHDLETDYEKAWRRWPGRIEDGETYHHRVLSLTHYCLSRKRAWDGFRFAEHGPFGEKGWGADDDELAHRWADAVSPIVVHAVQGIRVYRRASGSFRRLFKETGIWPNQYGSCFEKRLVWLQQEQPHHGKGYQWGEPWLTVIVKVGNVEETAKLIKLAHDELRQRHFAPPWNRYPNPYSIVAWVPDGDNQEFLDWAEPRRLRQHHGDTIIVDGEVIRKDRKNEETWTGDFRLWQGATWQNAVRKNAFYYGLITSEQELTRLLAAYNHAHPSQSARDLPAVDDPTELILED